MSSRRARRRYRHGGSGLRLFLKSLLVFIIVSALVVGIGSATAYALVQDWLKELPDISSPDAFKVAMPTRIYSADGKVLARLYLENRTVVKYSRIATELPDAIVAVEDERFYQHRGVDLAGILRAAVIDILAGSVEEGASTITQQYIRNTVLFDERTDITPARKVREMYLASELEKRKSKQEILELYLNTVYFGDGAYGAEAAARTYFSKHAKDLTLPEAALLAGLPQLPGRLSPFDNPEGATRRRNVVLARMLKNGYISQPQYDEAVATPLQLKRKEEPADGIYQAHYFVAHVKKLLQQKYPQSVVFKGGLKVYTTLDTRKQKYAEDAVERGLGQKGDPDCALVSIDPRNGYIKALVGGKDYEKSKFNLATQGKRQPGSSFKTFVLVTALEEGFSPNTYINSSSPALIRTGKYSPPWSVSNSEGRGRGMVTLQKGTALSINCVFARLIKEVGSKKVSKMARRMGITSEIPPYLSIALGSQNVTPLEMASAYGTLATGGVHYKPVAITKIVDSENQEIYKSKPKGKRAIDREIAYAATKVLKTVVSNGTAGRAQIGRPQAGKTGTSQNYRDAWFVGYTPQLVTSVWVGYYRSEKPMRSVHGMRGFGGTLAAPIWADYMSRALKGTEAIDFKHADSPKYKGKRAIGGSVPKKEDKDEDDKKKSDSDKKKKSNTDGDTPDTHGPQNEPVPDPGGDTGDDGGGGSPDPPDPGGNGGQHEGTSPRAP